MSELAAIVRSLARRRTLRIAAAAAPLAGLAAGGLPLLDAPGYELGEAGALLAALLLAPWLGLAAARTAGTRPEASPAAAWGAASLATLGLLALAFVGAAGRAALGPCRLLPGALAFLPVLAVPSALLGCAVAVGAARLARGRTGRAAGLYAAAVALSLGATLRTAWAGPAAFAADPFLGWWPGPLYDELLRVDARLLLTRLEVVAAAAALASALALGRPAPGGGPVPARARRGALAAAAAAAAALLSLAAALHAVAPSGRAALAAALGGVRTGPRCTVHLPAERSAAAADELLAECEFHVADVARALAIAAPPRVTVWVYRSADEKRRLVGAAATDYTKPWLAELHVTDSALPHPVLRHEIVHAVAAAIASGPLRVPARAGVLVSAGLVEGLAVALEVPRGAWTVHQWSRAARDLGLLPDVARIVGPSGFWAEAPARAYTAAGSFLGFLLERRGPGPVAAAYRTGDVAAAFGAPLAALVAEWQAFLDGVEVPEGLRAAARARLARGSLFVRRCARETAALEAEAGAAAAGGRTAEACRLLERVGALAGAPGALRERGEVLARAGDLAGALEAFRAARAAAPEEDRALRAALVSAEGDLAWRRGELAEAISDWSLVLTSHPDRAEERLLQAKLVAARDRELSPAARPWLLGLGDPVLGLARVARVDHPLAAYLVARAFAIRGEAAEAVPALVRAAAGPLPAALAGEARMALGEARCAAGDAQGGAAGLRALLAGDGAGLAEGDRERIAAALRRCAFEGEARP